MYKFYSFFYHFIVYFQNFFFNRYILGWLAFLATLDMKLEKKKKKALIEEFVF